jgi:hypothetical protein
MDLQGTKEARTQDEGDGPLDRSKEYHKERRDSHGHDSSANVHPLRRRQAPFAYPPGARSTASSARRDPSPSPEAIRIPQTLGLSSRDQRLLCKAKRYPPVTKKTLSELDLPCIMSNINLRMDANFDRDLHFKPDLDGEKGKRKRKEAADYWDSMASEITIYNYIAAQPESQGDSARESSQRTFDPRLPAMFETLQEVIKTLVPERDHPSVMQNLEVPLLMQQIRKGVLDMVALATWMAALLKTHCAPMRDEWADRMVEQITEGSQSQEPKEIVNGLQTLFAILEAMKLVRDSTVSTFDGPHTNKLIYRTSPITRSAHFGSFSSKIQFHSFRSTSKAKSAVEASRSSPPSNGTLHRGIKQQKKTLPKAQPPNQRKTLSLWKLSSTESPTNSSNLTHQLTFPQPSSSTRTASGNFVQPFKI